MQRLTMTDKEMDEIREYSPNFSCPVKQEENSVTEKFCQFVCDEFQSDCPFEKMAKKLKEYEDAEEQGLLLRLPCKPNEKVWIGHDKYCLHEGLYASISDIVSDMEDGYVIRYTKEEAEKALERMV